MDSEVHERDVHPVRFCVRGNISKRNAASSTLGKLANLIECPRFRVVRTFSHDQRSHYGGSSYLGAERQRRSHLGDRLTNVFPQGTTSPIRVNDVS